MRHSSYKTKPVSRIDLRNFVFALRCIMKYQDTAEIDVIRIFENDLYEIFGEDYRYQVVEVDQMDEYAIYLPDLNKIVVRADVYEAAASGNPRHRFTIAHEIGHFFLHRDVTKLARIDGKLPQLKPYEDPEWQANEFAGEFLAPAHLIQGLSIDEIMDTCGVSRQVAMKRFNNIRL